MNIPYFVWLHLQIVFLGVLSWIEKCRAARSALEKIYYQNVGLKRQVFSFFSVSEESPAFGGKHSMSNRKKGRKWRENTNQKAPDGFSRLEVFEKAATKKDDHNHPNSLQR